jgi:hypothetical protein
MSSIRTYPLGSSTILRINSEKDSINTSPEYQRNGDVWTLEKRQLLIDSIINDYDVPKLYFHVLSNGQQTGSRTHYDYAIIDGRQRLESIWSFIEGDFPLADDFIYLKDSTQKAAGLTYADLAKQYPKLKIIFDSFILPIICVETDDTELIEDMFSRLNEAVPLNAAEKRNAFGGPMAKEINSTSEHIFFKENVRFSNKRYQHKEIAARLLFIEHSLQHSKRIIDTKKPYLDSFVKLYKRDSKYKSPPISSKVTTILTAMHEVFSKRDELLFSQAAVPIYYLLFKEALAKKKLSKITRRKLLDFRKDLENNRRIAEEDIAKANFDLLEFDRMSQQGTNDASSIRSRLRILAEYLDIRKPLEETPFH